MVRKGKLDEQSKMNQSLVSAEHVGMYLIPSAQKDGRLIHHRALRPPLSMMLKLQNAKYHDELRALWKDRLLRR